MAEDKSIANRTWQGIPAEWDAALAGDQVMARLAKVTASWVKGAHDAELTIVNRHAYIVAEVDDEMTGESAGRPNIYSTLSIVSLESLEVEDIQVIACGEQAFDNTTLPEGAVFVPRIHRINEDTLRSYFASERPGKRQSQMWYRDFDIATRTFAPTIHKVKLKTAEGVFDMQPQHFHADAASRGFSKSAKDFGLYLFDSFKIFDGKTYIALNNFPGKQIALALVHNDFATFEILGHYNDPPSANLSESAVNRLPDGTWMAICRNDRGNYHFTTSKDGITWSAGRELPHVPNGASSKPTFDKFGDLYYLGWQEATRIHGVRRSVFNIDVSRDGVRWERKYRFETTKSFQYPTFREHDGEVWLTVTQGDHSPSRKERIMFGKLEKLGEFASQKGITRKPIPVPSFKGPTPGVNREIGIPLIDLSQDKHCHSIVAAGTKSVYQGHCDTVLLPDGKTMFTAWCLGHARWIGPISKSTDAGRSWSEPLEVPDNWKETSNTPALHRLVAPDGTARLFCFADGLDWNRKGKPPYPMHQSYSEDKGKSWTPMVPNGVQGEVPPKTILSFDEGKRLVMWSDLPDYVIQSESLDGGLTWSASQRILRIPSRWGQPCVIRSADGRTLLMLLRENSRKYQSLYSVSHDNAKTWSVPNELPAALTGDRHVAKLAPDGRLLVAFRDMAKSSSTYGHYVAWVGSFKNILEGTPGDYRLKLFHNALRKESDRPGQGNTDCGYSDLELLPDGTIIATTYLKYANGPEKHSVMNTRFTLEETDVLAGKQASLLTGKAATIEFASSKAKVDVFGPDARLFTDRQYRVAECPPALKGTCFLRGPIEGTETTVLSPGLLTVLTPNPTVKGAASAAQALERDGFRRVIAPQSFQLFGKNAIDQVHIYQKQVTAGTSLSYGKWCVLLGLSQESHRRPRDNEGATETLYNGIQLETDLRDRSDMAAFGDDPLPVPYLVIPPTVIPVDLGRQLFVDDFLIERTTLARTWHKARKDQHNPVMKPKTPLELGEANGHVPMAAPFSGGVWYDGADQLFKVWYGAGWFDGTAYATSTNGIDWTRPNLDIEPGSNRVIPAEGTRDSAAVILDPDAPTGGDRFKMLIWGRPKGGMLHVSKDGVHWDSGTHWGSSGDRSTIFYNSFRKKWVYSIRSGWHHRSREYAESTDFLGGAGLKNRVKWLRADDLDLPAENHFYAFPEREGPIKTPALYNFDAVAYESLMLGAFTIMTGPENNFCAAEGVPKMTEIHLGFSRDGFHWSRPNDRTPFIPGERDAGAWDRAYLHSNSALCLVVDDELWFYYTGFAGDPERKGKEFEITKNGMYANAAMGIARLRRDGFASMDADAVDGELVTRPILFSGTHLFVNADTSKGELRTEVLDLDGKPIAPFTAENCVPVAADKTRADITWRGAKNLAALAGKPVRLRFTLRNGSLYSFWLSKDATGKSGGYLAGGAPGHQTLRDE